METNATIISSRYSIDVDELAKEKVDEVDKLLDLNNNLKLDSIRSCFSILKQIITAADLHRTNDKNESSNIEQICKSDTSESIYADYSDDHEQFNAVDLSEQFATNSVKWTIRVRAFKSVHRIFHLLINTSRLAANKSTLLKLLPDLVRLSFVAATSPYDDLKIQGFTMFRNLINRFAAVEEKEFPGHSILEQYKTQVLSALKPAFNLDAPPYITAIACQVCSQWICRGLEKDPSSLKRAYQLMEPSIIKLKNQSINPNSLLYQEIELEQERVDILGSWAQLYITFQETSETSNVMKDLVSYHLDSLVILWWEALKDYALIAMQSSKSKTSSHDNNHVYTREVALELFSSVWPRLVLAATIWLCSENASQTNKGHSNQPNELICDSQIDDKKNISGQKKYFYFLSGLLMKEFCSRIPELDTSSDLLPESTVISLKTLSILLTDKQACKHFLVDATISREFYTVLYGVLNKSPNLKSNHQILIKNALSLIFRLLLSRIEGDNQVSAHSIALLLHFIDTELKCQEIKNLDIDELKLSILIYNLIDTIKITHEILANDEFIFKSFSDMIKRLFSARLSYVNRLNILDNIRVIQKTLPHQLSVTLSRELYATKLSSIDQLLTNHDSLESPEKIKASTILLEALLKSIKIDLEYFSSEERLKSIRSMAEVLLNDSRKFDNKKVLENLVIKCFKDLEKTNPDEFKALRDSEYKHMIDSILMTCEEDKKGPKVTKMPNAVKPQAKIILKADFSNFYAGKSQ